MVSDLGHVFADKTQVGRLATAMRTIDPRLGAVVLGMPFLLGSTNRGTAGTRDWPLGTLLQAPMHTRHAGWGPDLGVVCQSGTRRQGCRACSTLARHNGALLKMVLQRQATPLSLPETGMCMCLALAKCCC